MQFARAGLCLLAATAVVVALGCLHHTKIPPAGALLGLGAELALLFSGYLARAFRR